MLPGFERLYDYLSGRADSFASGRPSGVMNNSAASDTTQGDDDSGEDFPMAESPLPRLRAVDKRQSWDSTRDMFEAKRTNGDVHASGISEGSEEDEEDDDDEWCVLVVAVIVFDQNHRILTPIIVASLSFAIQYL